MKKGFTLIELLAVIVILAIIALIATPIILGIIEDARTEAKQRTAELVASAVELAYTSYLFDNAKTGAVPAGACDFMTKEHFSMDNGKLNDCAADATTTTVEASGVTFTVSYDGGVATITPAEGSGVEVETVKLATS